ncbi:MAG: hypothetical protein AB8F95_06900 [Bacteroidia bacterium]
MIKRFKYLFIGVCGVLGLVCILPYVFTTNPVHFSKSIELSIDDFDSQQFVSNLPGWEKWAWPWSEFQEVDIFWYDDTKGEYAGFFWDNGTQDGVLEAVRSNELNVLKYTVRIGVKETRRFSFRFDPKTDSTSTVIVEEFMPVGNWPWQRYATWVSASENQNEFNRRLEKLRETAAGR